jgi:predicted nucleic acid-binding protein
MERFDALIFAPPTLPVLGLDEKAGRLAGEFRALRDSLGIGSSQSDMMIAGIAMANGASLATRFVGNFTSLPISVVDPWT